MTILSKYGRAGAQSWRLVLKVTVAGAALLGAPLALAQDRDSATRAADALAYRQQCAVCHGNTMQGGQFGAGLKGEAFLNIWNGKTAGELYDYIATSMPPAAAGDLDPATYSAIVRHVLGENGVETDIDLSVASEAQLAALKLVSGAAADEEDFESGGGVGGLSKRFPLPPAPEKVDHFADFTPVTQAMLNDPEPENWLTWRRSHRGLGYSPLDQVTRDNVGALGLEWSLALPAGPNMNEPLVRDGVLYINSFGDEVFALDATNGEVLWRHKRQLPIGTNMTSKKSLALYGDKLFAATSDLHMIALDARTGALLWDSEITDKPGFRNPGGPLAADGVVMQGLTTQAAGGSLIAGFDAETGERLWTFNTVAQPDEPGGDTWNGLSAEERSGGSSWTSGTYDAQSGLAYFGTGATYDTGPLRDRKPGLNNDALYTDATLALEPRTGKLRWYFQHMKNDQWDLDWVFDRVIGTLEVEGKPRRVVMTAGKEGLFDTLDAATGAYIKTVDMGIQNFVDSIDPVTGDKHIAPGMVPDGKTPLLVCPHSGGGRNWGGTSYVEADERLFVVARDACMDMVPADGVGFLSTGVNIEYAPPPDSDGLFGILQSLDMGKGTIRWEVRQRAPFNTGVLTTAGGVLFTGSIDRRIMAYDQETGEELWHAGLSGVPNGSPITYSVNGKQYVAFVTGHGNPLSFGIRPLTPEIEAPPVATSGIYVFALPDAD